MRAEELNQKFQKLTSGFDVAICFSCIAKHTTIINCTSNYTF